MPHRSASPARHRADPVRRPWRGWAAGLGGVAVVTAAVVGVGSLSGAAPAEPVAATLAGSAVSGASSGDGVGSLSEEEIAEREARVSRSTERAAAGTVSAPDATKSGQLASEAGPARTSSQDLSDADPKTLARALMPEYGLSSAEFDCLDQLWESESGWSTSADNPTSSAYGIPQALPGSKMGSAGPNWETNAETQVRWGLGYVRDRYGSACSAWSFKSGNNWY